MVARGSTAVKLPVPNFGNSESRPGRGRDGFPSRGAAQRRLQKRMALPIRRPGLEAVATVDRLVAPRLERDFGGLAALAAGRLEHLAAAGAPMPPP